MADKKLYGAFFGPYVYEDDATLDDPDGDFSGMNWDASVSDGFHLCAGVRFLDSDQSNALTLQWNENDSGNRTLNFLVGGGNRSITLNENFTIGDGTDITITGVTAARSITLNENLTIADGYDVTLQALGQANQLTLNEAFTIGDGNAGTLTFSSACTLTVELASVLNQDLTTDASPTFAGLTVVNAIAEFSTDGTLGDNSDSALPSEKAVKTYVDAAIAAADYVAKSLFDADTFLYASVDNTPVATSPANVMAALSGHASGAFSFNGQNVTGGTYNALTLTAVAVGFTIAGGTTSKTLTVDETQSLTNYHTDARAATWLAANHETTYNHGNYDTAYGWGDHASGGYLKADGSVALSSRWDMFADIATDRWDDTDTNTCFGIGVCGAGNLSGATSLMALGYQAAYSITNGVYNVCMGSQAGYSLTTGDHNFYLGFQAGQYNATGAYSICIGTEAGQGVSGNNHSFNVFIGYRAGYGITTGDSNVCLGAYAGDAITTGTNNFGLGRGALTAETTGSYSIGIGRGALAGQNGGSNNIGIGYYANYRNVTGTSNTVIGHAAGYGVSANSHSNNTFIGYHAGYAVTTGGNNVCIGYNAGDVITSGTGNIIIGYGVDPSAADASNEINIGGIYKGDTSTTVPQFGTHAAIGAETVTGYITIKDLAGNDRKLAVVS